MNFVFSLWQDKGSCYNEKKIENKWGQAVFSFHTHENKCTNHFSFITSAVNLLVSMRLLPDCDRKWTSTLTSPNIWIPQKPLLWGQPGAVRIQNTQTSVPAETSEGPAAPFGSGFSPAGGRRAGSEGRRPEDPRSPRSAGFPPAPESSGCSCLQKTSLSEYRSDWRIRRGLFYLFYLLTDVDFTMNKWYLYIRIPHWWIRSKLSFPESQEQIVFR